MSRNFQFCTVPNDTGSSASASGQSGHRPVTTKSNPNALPCTNVVIFSWAPCNGCSVESSVLWIDNANFCCQASLLYSIAMWFDRNGLCHQKHQIMQFSRNEFCIASGVHSYAVLEYFAIAFDRKYRLLCRIVSSMHYGILRHSRHWWKVHWLWKQTVRT